MAQASTQKININDYSFKKTDISSSTLNSKTITEAN